MSFLAPALGSWTGTARAVLLRRNLAAGGEARREPGDWKPGQEHDQYAVGARENQRALEACWEGGAWALGHGHLSPGSRHARTVPGECAPGHGPLSQGARVEWGGRGRLWTERGAEVVGGRAEPARAASARAAAGPEPLVCWVCGFTATVQGAEQDLMVLITVFRSGKRKLTLSWFCLNKDARKPCSFPQL